MDSYAREYQDWFVLAMTGMKQGGTYLEVGGATPIQDSNTYLLETAFGWRGRSLAHGRVNGDDKPCRE